MWTGLGVDASGGPVIDPTKNVDSLFFGGMKRQDDLREAEGRHVREIISLDREYRARESGFMDVMREKESDRLDAIQSRIASEQKLDAERAQTAIQLVAEQQRIKNERDDIRIRTLELSSGRGEGKSEGFTRSWGILIAVVGLVGSFLGIAAILIPVVIYLATRGASQ